MTDLTAVLRAIKDLDENIRITDEIARHAANGFSSHAAYAVVFTALLTALLAESTVDLMAVRRGILASYARHQGEEIFGFVTTILDRIEADVAKRRAGG